MRLPKVKLSMPNNYQAWRKKSEENLKWADDNLKAGNFPLVCYLAQQAVELLLKGYLYSQNKIPPKTHQLIRLAKFSEKLGLKIKDLLAKLAVLSEYYLESRYPDQLNVDLNDRRIAVEALEAARKIYKEIVRQLPKEAQS